MAGDAPDFADRDGFIWLDDKLVPWREAKIHVCSHGNDYGGRVFEGERAYHGRIFRSLDHTRRLFNSAALVGIDTRSLSVEKVEEAKHAVLEANNFSDCYLRPSIWRGSKKMGVSPTGTDTRFAVAVWPDWTNYYEGSVRENGITLRTSEIRRPHPNSARLESKSAANYTMGSLAKQLAEQSGVTEALMLDWEGNIAECSSANIFFVDGDGVIHTPLADGRFLNGITRQTAIVLAKNAGLTVEERRIAPEEIPNMREAFVTGTAVEILPVRKIDDTDLVVGDVTRSLSDAYQKLVRSDNGTVQGVLSGTAYVPTMAR